MGWAGGSEVGNRLWDRLRPILSEEHRKEMAEFIIQILEDEDCDTLDECPQLLNDAGK